MTGVQTCALPIYLRAAFGDGGAQEDMQQGADVASANDLTLGTGNSFEITGTTQINAITISPWNNGKAITLLFTAGPLVKHNTAGGAGTAVMLLHGAIDWTPVAGDRLTLRLCEIGGAQAWREISRTTAGRWTGGQGADIASANDLTLGTDGNAFEVTGTTQVNALTTAGWRNGSIVTLLFTATPTVKHNTAGGAGTAVCLLAGAADFVASAGDTLTLLLCEIGGAQAWREIGRAVI